MLAETTTVSTVSIVSDAPSDSCISTTSATLATAAAEPQPVMLSFDHLKIFENYLLEEERAEGTIENYLRDLKRLIVWLDGRPLTKELMVEYKAYLTSQNYAATTINAKLSPLNTFFIYMGWAHLRVKFLQIQQKLFRDKSKDLTEEDYKVLIETAYKLGLEKLALIMETLCSTGMRVGELKYITMEVIEAGEVEIRHKGKIRTIVLTGKLCRKLKKYASKKKITSGEIFLSEGGFRIGRRQIWSAMKALCRYCGVAASKVFPHNLRHLFAVKYYAATKDIVKLSGLLGHSSIETTRRYLLEPVSAYQEQLERLNLVM